jgi:hypothetical protein
MQSVLAWRCQKYRLCRFNVTAGQQHWPLQANRLAPRFASATNSAMSDRSDPAADRTQIADLVHLYAQHIRRGEPRSAAALFAEDAVFEVREMDPLEPASPKVRSRAEGRMDIDAYITSSTAQARMVPMIHNLLVELAGDRATASSLMIGRIWPSPREVVGEYADSFRRVGGRWLFAERTYTIWLGAS